MNRCEHEMLDVLKRLRQDFGAISVKAEFEAEGTRTEELLRLIDVARRGDLMVGLKIGGAEAVRDLIESKQFGVEYIIAPMVETPYALSKYIEAKNKVYSADQQEDTKFLFNIETITTFNNLSEMIKIGVVSGGVQGGVFGRVDFTGSLGWGRPAIDTDAVTDYVIKTGEACKAAGLELVVGGAVAIDSLPALAKIYSVYLTRFETRKVIFAASALDNPKMSSGLEQTVYFELLWLKNKRDYYGSIQVEDAARIAMLERRWAELSA
ncbi:MAG: aldolase/citrate lyase family protein [Bradyrhizobium sp.]|nr:aldolase/citrate lyase family protein [Bradyrhizobium sp.]